MIEPGDWAQIEQFLRQRLEPLDVLVRQLQQLKVRFGQATITFPGGSRYSNTITPSHGMGSTPIAACAGPAQAAFYVGGVASLSSTTIGIQIATLDGSTPANGTPVTVYWIAVG